MALWNQKNLLPPMVMNAPCKSKPIKEQLIALSTTSSKMLNYYSTLTSFEMGAAFLTRFCNRWKHRLRNMYGFQTMRRINQTLLRIKHMDFKGIVLDFQSFLPDAKYIEREVNLPVRSNLEYILVRMQGLAKLLLRVVYLTQEAARYVLKQIANRFLYNIYSVFLALMGELWLLARSMCRYTNQFYGELYATLSILPLTKVNWLPEDYELPASLATWLGDEYQREILHYASDSTLLNVGVDSNIFTLLQHRGTDEEETILSRIDKMLKEDGNRPREPQLNALPKRMLLESMRVDTGQLVARAAKDVRFDPEKLNHIRSKFHVQQFISQESNKRNNNLKDAATCSISEDRFAKFNVGLMMEFKRLSSAEFVKLFKAKFLQLLNSE